MEDDGTKPQDSATRAAQQQTRNLLHTDSGDFQGGSASSFGAIERLAGQVLDGKYRLDELLGTGGMGTVFAAEQVTLGRSVAVKVLHERLDPTATPVRRLIAEGRAAAALDHPNVVAVTDIGCTNDGEHYIVMERLEGQSLEKLVHQRGSFDWRSACQILLQVLAALGAAHDLGVIHRDVKPSNCFALAGSTSVPRIKLLDFGLAKSDGLGSGASYSTAAGAVMGTPAYLSPEQAHCEAVDPRSDLYSAGILLFELLTGRPPFRGRSAFDVLMQQLNDPVPRLREILPDGEFPALLEAIVDRAVEKEPQHRFQSAKEFAAALEEVLERPSMESSAKTGRVASEHDRAHGRGRESGDPGSARGEGRERQELALLMRKVRRMWIDGVLEESLGDDSAMLTPRTSVEFDPVLTPWSRFVGMQGRGEDVLGERDISEVFDALNQSLLILGPPGSGKTITLLTIGRRLARRFERRAGHDEPVPVVFPLSEWRTSTPDMSIWLVRQLREKYQVPPSLAERWLQGRRVLPLLDGLDEVRPADQAACVAAINRMRDEITLPGLIVCSRTEDYMALPLRLKLFGAVCLHHLTDEQVDRYLELGGGRWGELRSIIRADEALAQLARTPLMLNVIVSAYRKDEDFGGDLELSLEGRRAQIYDAFISRALQRPGKLQLAVSEARLLKSLTWLARRLSAQRRTIFSFDSLQPSWLESTRSRLAYLLLSRALPALWFGASFVLSMGLTPLDNDGLEAGLPWGLRVGWSSVLVVSVMLLLGSAWDLRRGEAAPREELSHLHTTVRVLAGGALCGVAIGALIGHDTNAVGFGMGVELGVMAGIVFWAHRGRARWDGDVRTIWGLRWSWARIRTASPWIVAASAIPSIWFWQIESPESATCLAVVLGSLGVALAGLVGSPRVSAEPLGRAIKRTATHSLALGVVFGAMIWALFAAFYGVAYGLYVAVNLGSLVMLWYGATDVIKHYMLRLMLGLDAPAARGLATVLHDATDRVLLRQVGGGFAFIHPTFQEHLLARVEDTP